MAIWKISIAWYAGSRQVAAIALISHRGWRDENSIATNRTFGECEGSPRRVGSARLLDRGPLLASFRWRLYRSQMGGPGDGAMGAVLLAASACLRDPTADRVSSLWRDDCVGPVAGG